MICFACGKSWEWLVEGFEDLLELAISVRLVDQEMEVSETY